MKRFVHSTRIAGILLLLGAIVSTQLGSSWAKQLFSTVGPESAVTLRLLFGTILLFAFLRPWKTMPRGRQWRTVIAYGLSIGLMNTFFYQAISRIPIGITVAFEFTGPLTVAVISSRKWLDYAAVALAAAGLALLLPLTGFSEPLDPAGIIYALLAASCWAGYILLSRAAGTQAGTNAVAWAMLAGTIAILPWASVASGFELFHPGVLLAALPLGIAIGVFGSALPFWLELKALTIVRPQVYGVFMSLEPAAGALFGFLMLGESLSLVQCLAIALVVSASAIITMEK